MSLWPGEKTCKVHPVLCGRQSCLMFEQKIVMFQQEHTTHWRTRRAHKVHSEQTCKNKGAVVKKIENVFGKNVYKPKWNESGNSCQWCLLCWTVERQRALVVVGPESYMWDIVAAQGKPLSKTIGNWAHVWLIKLPCRQHGPGKHLSHHDNLEPRYDQSTPEIAHMDET